MKLEEMGKLGRRQFFPQALNFDTTFFNRAVRFARLTICFSAQYLLEAQINTVAKILKNFKVFQKHFHFVRFSITNFCEILIKLRFFVLIQRKQKFYWFTVLFSSIRLNVKSA